MKRFVLFYLVLLLSVFGIYAAQGGGTIPQGFISQGPTEIVTALDTVTAASKTVYKAKPGGGFWEQTLYPTAYHIEGLEKFWYKAFWANGDSSGATHSAVTPSDSLFAETTIYGRLSSIRITPTASDTVRVTPLFEWPEGWSPDE